MLKRNKLADNLNSKLRKRPGPLELVTRKILQVDAELEQAIQEGRLPFTPVESTELVSSSGMISTQLAPNRFEDVKTPLLPHNQTPPLLTTNGPKAKIRKKSQQIRASTPYDSNCSNGNKIIKMKSISGNRRYTDSSIVADTNVPMETDSDQGPIRVDSNYEITLHQQQMFLQWHEVDISLIDFLKILIYFDF